jgi:hypothetical protein
VNLTSRGALTGHGGWWLGGGTHGAQPVMQVTGRDAVPPATASVSAGTRTRKVSFDNRMFFMAAPWIVGGIAGRRCGGPAIQCTRS